MPIVTGNAAPSTLADVLQATMDILHAQGDATPIQVGEKFLENFGAGSPPKILFVPERGGTMGPPRKLGFDCSYTHGCDVFVRALPGQGPGDPDVNRYEPAHRLLAQLASALKRAGGGLLVWTGLAKGASPATTDGPGGVGIGAHFTYTRDIPKHVGVYTVPAQSPDVLAADAVVQNPPPGQPASGTPVFSPTTTPPDPPP